MEITRPNFEENFDKIAESLRTCVFISLDAEFSGLPMNHSSLFDTAGERYTKLRRRIDGIIATQIGLSAFHYDRDRNSYKASTYTFHLRPHSVGSVDQFCTFQSSALDFLTNHSFDFNKILYKGIPYLNKREEILLRRDINNEELESHLDSEESHKILHCVSMVSEWLTSAEKNETKIITGNTGTCYLMTLKLRTAYPKLLISNKGFEVAITKIDEMERPKSVTNDEAVFINHALGFSRVVKVLEEVKKPLVLHNAFLDLLIFFNQFLEPLPARYDSFKNSVHDVFPKVFDTKFISNEMKFEVKKDQFSDSTALETLFNFFAQPKGLHLAIYTPYIAMKDEFDVTPQFHQAGWDSYCTGYCFIRLCHWSACLKHGSDHLVTSTEHINSLERYSNCIYLSRAAQLYLCLSSDDPPKHRPEYLHVEVSGNQKINMSQVVSSMSKFGSIDVKKYGKKCALVAVPNQICARKILTEFYKSSDWKVARYNTLKHSPVARLALWGGFLVSSGSLIALILHKIAT